MQSVREILQIKKPLTLPGVGSVAGKTSALDVIGGGALLLAGLFVAYLVFTIVQEQRSLAKLRKRQRAARLSYSKYRRWACLPTEAPALHSLVAANQTRTATNITPLPLTAIDAEKYSSSEPVAA